MIRLSNKRFFYVMAGLTTLLPLLILAATAFGNKLLTQQAAKLADLRAESQVIEEQKLALIQGKKDVERYSTLDQVARTIVPQDKNQARTIREINAIAAASGINLQTITFSASSLGEQAKPAPQSGNDEGGSETPAAPATPAKPKTDITQVMPVEGIPGVFALQLSINPAADQAISYPRFLEFLERLENNRRTAHVANISVTPVEGSSGITFTLTLNVYLKP